MKKVTISFEDMLATIQSNYINKIKLIFSLFRQIMAMKKISLKCLAVYKQQIYKIWQTPEFSNDGLSIVVKEKVFHFWDLI